MTLRLAALALLVQNTVGDDPSCVDTALDPHDGEDPPAGFVSCADERTREHCAWQADPTDWAERKCRATCGACIQDDCAPRCMKSPMSWNDARRHCADVYDGATLVSVRDAATNDWLKANGPFDDHNLCAWTGFNDKAEEGAWAWKNGDAPASFEDWHSGEPNDGFGSEDCMAVCANERHGWHDFVCSAPWPFCCEPPSDCGSADAAPEAPGGDAPPEFCATFGFSPAAYTPARRASRALTCEQASAGLAVEWARCCCGHAKSCCPDGDEPGCLGGDDDDDGYTTWRGDGQGRRSGDDKDRPPPLGGMIMVFLLSAFALFALVLLRRKYKERRHDPTRDVLGDRFAPVARDEATGLELEIADGVEMM
jgi:hypothetical protein